MEQAQNGKQLVQYLLGDLSDEEQSQLDEQLFINDEYFERLLVTEDELIDDYLRGRLSEKDRQLFERTFLSSPHLRQRVNLARSLLTYIDDKARLAAQPSRIRWYESETSQHERQLGVSHILKTGRRQYTRHLAMTGLIRVSLLASLSLLLSRATSTSGLIIENLVVVVWISVVCYTGLELLNLFWLLKVASHATTPNQPHENDF